MWQKNNGKSETEILQNQFTAYLATAVQHRRNDYIQQITRLQQTEYVTDMIEDNQKYDMEKDILSGLPLFMQLEDSALIHALKEVNERERHIFLARILEERSFESLAEEMGIGYKSVTTIYYRTLRKIKKKMREVKK